MHLVNFPKVRRKKYKKGFVAEIQLKKWWGKTYWKHMVSVSGMPDSPWFYPTEELAIDQACKNFKWDIIFYSNSSCEK